ncbi:MAG TPA: YkgJ family cysteine cluster protein, partial [Cyanobacteria bacterium UBA8553]|nr:YkgJ family cysteine cluster protein [Cyanobacteria bacterium UBA8553]
MATWRCVKQCGACCNLDPAERPDLDEYLTPEELELYLSMVGEGGWCVNFDQSTRECRIYAARPRFCRVQDDVFQDMFGVEPAELNDFAID